MNAKVNRVIWYTNDDVQINGRTHRRLTRASMNRLAKTLDAIKFYYTLTANGTLVYHVIRR